MSINDKKRKAVLIVVDSCGVGALPDAKDFGDEGVNTISHLAKAAGGVNLPADFKEFAVFPGGSANEKDSVLVYMLNVRLKEFEDRGCEDVMREFNGCNYTSRSDYRDYMDTDDTEVYAGTSFFGNDKYEEKYCYKDVNKACEEYIGDLKDAINYVDYDSQVLDTIDAALNDYKERVQKEIDKKVALLSKALQVQKQHC